MDNTKVRLGRTELYVTKTSFGALPVQRIGHEAARKLLRRAYDRGINYFDTANAYSDSEEKIGEALKVFDIEPMTVDVVLRYEKNPSNPNPAIVEVTVRARGSVIRVAEHGADMYAAIDLSADKVTRQLRKFKTKVVDNRQGGASAADVAPVERVEDLADLLLPEEEDDLLVREKVIDVTPMTEEQALVQTDLLGHDFYVFENATTGLINVVYHRKNGGYGIIKPRIETLDE